MPRSRRILATSGGFLAGPGGWGTLRRGPLIDYALGLAERPRPRITYLAVATGDAATSIQGFYSAFAGCEDAIASHLALFPMPNVVDVRAHLLKQDVVWVGGGSVANLLAVWRAHGLDEVLRECWEAGVVLGGVSAGSICWHVGGTTDSFGLDLRPVTNGLGFLPYGNGVHYDSEAQRRPLLHRLVGDGTLPLSYATDDGVGILYEGVEPVDVVTDRRGAAAYRIEVMATGGVSETRLEARLLA